jgi:glycosyltransferase involved in cell wall biosynthesis
VKIALYELSVTLESGGIQTSYWETAKRLAAMGHEVHMYGAEGPVRWQMPENVKVLEFPFIARSRFPDFGTRFRKFAERISFGRNAITSLLENRYDIIYIRKPYEMPISLYVKKRTGAKVVFRSGGTEFYPGYKFFAKRLDAFLSCSAYNARQIYKYCKVEPSVVYNGVDTERFSLLPKNREIMATHGLREDEFVLVSVTRLVGWKGIQYALRSIALLDNKKIKYLIVGSGEYESELIRITRKESLEDQVIFSGAVENKNVPQYYSVADAVLFPTIGDDDAFPNALCEAMSCGKPAIGSLKGGIPEAIVDQKTGFLVAPADPRLIADKISILLSNPDLRRDMGRNARQRVIDLFSWDIIVKQLEGIFCELHA